MKQSLLLLTLTTLLTFGLAGPASAQERWGVVNLSAAFLRSAPDYESALETQALMGSVVEILGEQGYWRQVAQHDPEYTAWMTELGVVELSRSEMEAYLAAPKYICTAALTQVYDKSSGRRERIGELVQGDLVRQALDGSGYPVRALGFNKVILPDGREGFVRSLHLKRFTEWAQDSFVSVALIGKTARSFLGVPYLWGGASSKNLDCSGLVWMTYFLNGVILPRNASQQARCGAEVQLNKLREGDLIFFGTPATADKPERVAHVGISLGDKLFIHASHVVRINSLDPEADNYYDSKTPLFARRIFDHRGGLFEDEKGNRVVLGPGVIAVKDSQYYF